MRIEKLIILIFITVLVSCVQKNTDTLSKPENEIAETKVKIESKTIKKEVQIVESLTKPLVNENSITLKFDAFELKIDSVSVWDEEEKLKQTQKDTAVVYLELGESIEGQKIKINKLKKGDLKIYQRFENSVTVMNEGPHCDLTEWKHYDSKWIKLKVNNDEFITDSYSEKNREKFIDVDMNALREAVRNQCGDEWAEYIKDANSPTEYPCGVSTSRIFLKIEFSNQVDSKTLEKIISFEIPMGC